MQIGTACVTRGQDSRLALGRLGALVEQLETLVRGGREVILVTSGLQPSCGMLLLHRTMQHVMTVSVYDQHCSFMSSAVFWSVDLVTLPPHQQCHQQQAMAPMLHLANRVSSS